LEDFGGQSELKLMGKFSKQKIADVKNELDIIIPI
jgi:hypothetical protein